MAGHWHGTMSSVRKFTRETLIALRARRAAHRVASSVRYGYPDDPAQPPTGKTDEPPRETGGDLAGWAALVWLLVAIVFVVKHLLGLKLLGVPLR